MSDKRTGVVIGVLGLLLAIPGTIVALNELGTINIFPVIFNDQRGTGRRASRAAAAPHPPKSRSPPTALSAVPA